MTIDEDRNVTLRSWISPPFWVGEITSPVFQSKRTVPIVHAILRSCINQHPHSIQSLKKLQVDLLQPGALTTLVTSAPEIGEPAPGPLPRCFLSVIYWQIKKIRFVRQKPRQFKVLMFRPTNHRRLRDHFPSEPAGSSALVCYDIHFLKIHIWTFWGQVTYIYICIQPKPCLALSESLRFTRVCGAFF